MFHFGGADMNVERGFRHLVIVLSVVVLGLGAAADASGETWRDAAAAAEEKATQAYLQTSVWAMHAITAAGPIIGALAELGCQWRLPVPL